MAVNINRYALLFNGAGSVKIPNKPNISFESKFTIEAWIKPNNLSTRRAIFSTREKNAPGSWQFEAGTASGGTNRLAVTGVGTWIIETVDNVVSIGVWQHVAYVRDSGNDKIYVNGIEQPISTKTPYAIVDNLDNILIGSGVVSGFDGIIDEVRVWNTARTQEEIQANMNTQLMGNEFGLVGYWKFNEGTGTVARDASVVWDDGVVSGATYTTDVPILIAQWIEPKTDWGEEDFYNYHDLDRVENNSEYLANLLSSYRGQSVSITAFTDRYKKRFEFYDSMNRIESNIQTLADNFFEPVGWIEPKTDWESGQPFGFRDANRLERNLALLHDLLLKAFESYKYCGTFYAGEDGDIY